MERRRPFLLLLAGLCALTDCLPLQYHLISTALPWPQAQTYCRERYADLATVFDVEGTNRLVNAAQDSTGGFTEKAWIGLHDNLTSWQWSFSASSYYEDEGGNYRNWDYGQPDNFLGDQMCVKMGSGGLWEDSGCFLRNPFICYDGSIYQRFVFVEQEMSWRDAQLYCRNQYTDLASVGDQEENQEVHLLTKNRSAWIGLSRAREWSDRSDSTYQNWKAGQPDNVGGKQSCVATDLGNAGLWSDEQCERQLAFICYGEKREASDSSPLSTTTVTPKTTTGTESTTGRLSADMTLSAQPSSPHVAPTRPITNESPNMPVLPTTTTVTANERTTAGIESTTGHVSTEITTSEQPLTSQVEQLRTVTNPALSTTIVTLHKQSPTETESTTSHVSTTPEQPQTLAVEQIKTVTGETPNQTILSSTKKTPNKISTARRDSTSTAFTSSVYFSTAELHQTTSIPDFTPNSAHYSTAVTLNPNERSTTETHFNTSPPTPKVTSFKQPSSPHVDQTRPVTEETPPSSLLSITAVTPHKSTTTETESVSGQPSVTDVDSQNETPHGPLLSTPTMTPTERDSVNTEVSSEPHSTPEVDQRSAELIINLRVSFTSKKPLSEDDVKQLVLVEFHDRLIEMGLPTSIKVGLRTPLK